MPPSATGFPRVFVGSHAVAEAALTPEQLRGPSFVRVVPGVYAPADVARDHALRLQQEEDRRQDHELAAAGWTALRITAADLAEAGRAVALVRAAAARAA